MSLTETITSFYTARLKGFGSSKAEHLHTPVDPVSSQTEQIIASLDAVQPEAFGGNEVERLKVRAAARRLLARVETPYERAWGFCFEQPVVFAALQTCIDVGLWKSWTSVGGEKSIDELVKLTSPTVDTNLLRKSSSSSWHCLRLTKAHRSVVPFASGFQCGRRNRRRQIQALSFLACYWR